MPPHSPSTGHLTASSSHTPTLPPPAGPLTASSSHTPTLPHPAGPLTAEQCQQLFQLLDSTVSQALAAQLQQQQGAGRPLLALVAGLGRRLEALGALAPVANMAVLARYSAHLTDMLPKQQWAQGEGGGIRR